MKYYMRVACMNVLFNAYFSGIFLQAIIHFMYLALKRIAWLQF